MRVSFSMNRMASVRALTSAFVCAVLSVSLAWAQQPAASPPQDQPEVLRVYTQLVQTDVMVFDSQGKFVNNLKREDFELRIDGKTRPVEFFERITAGSRNEELQLAAARGASTMRVDGTTVGPTPLDRGRPIFFYVDDLHLDLGSVNRTRNLLTRFVDQEMGQNDEAAITSASGQIGFLQQLTDNRTVLHAAIDQLKFRKISIRDFDRPPMSEFQALRIEGYDTDTTDYFVDETMKSLPGITRDAALSMVNSRAHALLSQAGRLTSDSLAGLEALVKSAKTIPGRKLVFFVSDGFFLDRKNSAADMTLQRITSAAAKSGVVIYSIDARGLVASMTDPSSPSQADPTGRLQRGTIGEISASQDSLNALARDTGGRAFFNSNALEPAVTRALKESSTYYLLAWKPDPEVKTTSKFRRIEVRVAGKSGLTVQVRRGFFDVEPTPPTAANNKTVKRPPAAKGPAAELAKVIGSPFPAREIPIALSLNYLNLPDKGTLLSAAMQVPRESFSFAPVNGKETAVVDVGGTFFNAKGQPGAEFTNRITITAATPGQKVGEDLAYGHPVFLSPGLYHVRVGARDERSGRMGTAHDWIEIPDLSKGQLALSSVLVGVRPATIGDPALNHQQLMETLQLSIHHSFPANDYLRFLVFIYNAARATPESKPDVAIQVQIVRDEQPVVTTPLRKVSTESTTDMIRIPYAAEVSLAGLPSGRYLLKLTAVDRVTKRSASQQTRFEIQ